MFYSIVPTFPCPFDVISPLGTSAAVRSFVFYLLRKEVPVCDLYVDKMFRLLRSAKAMLDY